MEKIDKSNFIKNKNFCFLKDTLKNKKTSLDLEKVDQWLPKIKVREGTKGKKRLQKGSWKLLGVVDMFTLLILMTISWTYTYVKDYQLYTLKYAVYCMSFIPLWSW